MTTALLIVIAVAVVVGVGLLTVTLRRTLPGPTLVGQTVVVNTVNPDDRTIRGILVRRYADRLELESALYVTPAGEQPMQGTITIPTGQVAWMQMIGG